MKKVCDHCGIDLYEDYYTVDSEEMYKDVCQDCAREIAYDLILSRQDFSVDTHNFEPLFY